MVLLAAIVGAAAGFAYAYSQPVVYRADAEILLPLAETQRIVDADAAMTANQPISGVAFTESTNQKRTIVAATAGSPETAENNLAAALKAFEAAYEVVQLDAKARLQSEIDKLAGRLSKIDGARERLDAMALQVESREPMNGTAFAALIATSNQLLDNRYSLNVHLNELESKMSAIQDHVIVSRPRTVYVINERNPYSFSVYFGVAAILIALSFVYFWIYVKTAMLGRGVSRNASN